MRLKHLPLNPIPDSPTLPGQADQANRAENRMVVPRRPNTTTERLHLHELPHTIYAHVLSWLEASEQDIFEIVAAHFGFQQVEEARRFIDVSGYHQLRPLAQSLSLNEPISRATTRQINRDLDDRDLAPNLRVLEPIAPDEAVLGPRMPWTTGTIERRVRGYLRALQKVCLYINNKTMRRRNYLEENRHPPFRPDSFASQSTPWNCGDDFSNCTYNSIVNTCCEKTSAGMGACCVIGGCFALCLMPIAPSIATTGAVGGSLCGGGAACVGSAYKLHDTRIRIHRGKEVENFFDNEFPELQDRAQWYLDRVCRLLQIDPSDSQSLLRLHNMDPDSILIEILYSLVDPDHVEPLVRETISRLVYSLSRNDEVIRIAGKIPRFLQILIGFRGVERRPITEWPRIEWPNLTDRGA